MGRTVSVAAIPLHVLLGSCSPKFLEALQMEPEKLEQLCAHRSSQTFDVQNLSVPTIEFLQWFPESQIEHSGSLLHSCLHWKSNGRWKVHVCVCNVLSTWKNRVCKRDVRFAFWEAIIWRNERCWFYSIKRSCWMEGKQHGMNLWKAGEFTEDWSHSS